MKLKNLAYEDAQMICINHLKDKELFFENSCDNCPLKLEILGDFCGKSFAFINKEFGNKEIKLERNDKDE